MAWKSKPSVLIPTRISNPVWMRYVDFYFGKHQGHKSPTVNTDLTLKDPTKSLRRIACDALEVASWSPCPFTRLRGHVPFIKLDKTKLRLLSDPEPRLLSDPEPRLLSDPGLRSSTIQSRVLKSSSFHKPKGHETQVLRCSQQFRAASSQRARVASPQ